MKRYKRRRTGLNLDENLFEPVVHVAKDHGLSVSSLINAYLKELMEQQHKKSKCKSCQEKANFVSPPL